MHTKILLPETWEIFVQGATHFEKNFNPLSTNPRKWSDTLKQFVDELLECVWPFCEVGA